MKLILAIIVIIVFALMLFSAFMAKGPYTVPTESTANLPKEVSSTFQGPPANKGATSVTPGVMPVPPGFRGPTSPPNVIGPKAPPPQY